MNAHTFEHLLRTQLPIAWIAGVRFKSYDGETFKTCVEHDFLNQNPFGSMFWAVQGMAAEFAGGCMIVDKIKATGKSISSLVIKSEGSFHKKAVGSIIFTCSEGKNIAIEIQKAIETGEARVFELTSVGIDESGHKVSEFVFTWSIKPRN